MGDVATGQVFLCRVGLLLPEEEEDTLGSLLLASFCAVQALGCSDSGGDSELVCVCIFFFSY